MRNDEEWWGMMRNDERSRYLMLFPKSLQHAEHCSLLQQIIYFGQVIESGVTGPTCLQCAKHFHCAAWKKATTWITCLFFLVMHLSSQVQCIPWFILAAKHDGDQLRIGYGHGCHPGELNWSIPPPAAHKNAHEMNGAGPLGNEAQWPGDVNRLPRLQWKSNELEKTMLN